MADFPETRVDPDIINRIAPAYHMGAGGLKGMLLGDPDPEDTPCPPAVRRAYELQDERDQQEDHDDS